MSFALEQCSNDHTLACIRSLLRFYNSSGNAVRHLLVANVCKDLGAQDPESQSGLKLLESLDSLIAAKVLEIDKQATITLSVDVHDAELADPLPREVNNHYIKLLPLQKFDIEEGKTDCSIRFTFKEQYFKTRKVAFDLGLEDNDWIFDDIYQSDEEEEEDGDVEWEYYVRMKINDFIRA